MRETLSLLAAQLRDQAENLVLMEALDSTHAMALRLIEQMEDEGLELGPTAVIAAMQSAGRGRCERGWCSPFGGLYLNWLRSGVERPTVARLPMLAAAAAHTAIARTGVERLAIKWPNDIVIDNAKLAGILIHARGDGPAWVTVGLGVNLTATPTLEDLAPRPATSLADHLPAADWRSLAVSVASGFLRSLAGSLHDFEQALSLWRAQLVHRKGDPMTVRLGSGEVLEGRFSGLTDEGFLRLAGPDRERVITSGDIIDTTV